MIIAQKAQDVAAIISDMGFDKAIVFGNSGGGNIALELATTRSYLKHVITWLNLFADYHNKKVIS